MEPNNSIEIEYLSTYDLLIGHVESFKEILVIAGEALILSQHQPQNKQTTK